MRKNGRATIKQSGNAIARFSFKLIASDAKYVKQAVKRL